VDPPARRLTREMCGCVSAKAGSADDPEGAKQEAPGTEDAGNKEEEDSKSKQQPPGSDPPDGVNRPDFTIEGLLEALAGSLALDSKQLVVLRKWCRTLSIPEMYPSLELTLHGDASMLEVTATVAPEQMLAALPGLLALLPEERPSPPAARDPVEAPRRPPRQLAPEPVVAAPPPADNAVSGTLPMTVVGDGRPRSKAKAKAKVKAQANLFTPSAASPAAAQAAPPSSPVRRPESTAVASLGQDEPSEPPPAMPPASLPQREEPPPSSYPFNLPKQDAQPPPSEPVSLPKQDAQPRSARAESEEGDDDIGEEGATVSQVQVNLHAQRPGKVVDRPSHGKLRGESVDVKAAAAQWREALQRVMEELAATRAMLWLQLGDLGLPRGGNRRIDLGVRLCAPAGRGASFMNVEPYEDAALSLADVEITDESGWCVGDMGCSLFAHGPLVLFTINRIGEKCRCDRLLQKVAPASLTRAVQSLAYSSSVRMSVRAGQLCEGAQLGALFELSGAQPGDGEAGFEKDLQSLAVDLALGKERLFDAILLERFRQTLASVGASTTVTSIECRADDVALVTLSVSSCGTSV